MSVTTFPFESDRTRKLPKTQVWKLRKNWKTKEKKRLAAMISVLNLNNPGYCLPGLMRNSTRERSKLKQKTTPKVNIQGRKCFEKIQEICQETVAKTSSKTPKDVCYGHHYSSEESKDDSSSTESISEDFKATEQFRTLSDSPDTFSALEGRKMHVKVIEKTTIKRVRRLRIARLKSMENHEVHPELVENPQKEIKPRKKVYQNRENCLTENLSRKNASKRVLEVAKVESYEILTPRTILSSEACQVFRGKTVETTCPKTHGSGSPLNRLKTIFDAVEDNTIEFRQPSPVHGMRLNPKEEIQCIDKALELVEKSNMLENLPDLPSIEKEQSPVVKKFVIRLPPIF